MKQVKTQFLIRFVLDFFEILNQSLIFKFIKKKNILSIIFFLSILNKKPPSMLLTNECILATNKCNQKKITKIYCI